MKTLVVLLLICAGLAAISLMIQKAESESNNRERFFIECEQKPFQILYACTVFDRKTHKTFVVLSNSNGGVVLIETPE